MLVDAAPPVRIVAVVTLFCATLDLFADLLMSYRLYQYVDTFEKTDARNACYAYFFFTAVSIVVYTVEMIEVFITLKNDEEIPFYTKLAKSMVIALEEVPLTICMYIIVHTEPRPGIASSAIFWAIIKLIALVWGITKFMKLKFCWICLPCLLDHGFHENTRRCFTFVWWRIAMIVVNICHLLAIILVIMNLSAASASTGPATAAPPTT